MENNDPVVNISGCSISTSPTAAALELADSMLHTMEGQLAVMLELVKILKPGDINGHAIYVNNSRG